MNKERYNQIVDEVYKNYVGKLSYNENDCFADEDINKPNKTFIPYNQEEFINKIKTDDEFAKKWGELGPIYGKQWRKWNSGIWNETFDQIQNLINELKTNPDSRRLMVNAWNVADLPVTDYRTDDELYQDYLKDFEKK